MTTAYHETTRKFRAELVTSANHFTDVKAHYSKITRIPDAPQAAGDAYSSALMAMNYAYTLAAVLGTAERQFGTEVAARLAAVAAEILTNGDDADRNADLKETS